jgi:hypothetical protein
MFRRFRGAIFREFIMSLLYIVTIYSPNPISLSGQWAKMTRMCETKENKSTAVFKYGE